MNREQQVDEIDDRLAKLEQFVKDVRDWHAERLGRAPARSPGTDSFDTLGRMIESIAKPKPKPTKYREPDPANSVLHDRIRKVVYDTSDRDAALLMLEDELFWMINDWPMRTVQAFARAKAQHELHEAMSR